MITLSILLGFGLQSIAQEISVWQFRNVEQSNMQEFIDRETKYWSKVAEAAIEKGNLTFWGLFVKEGGFDLPNTPNVIFVNTFNDINAANMAEIWNASALFPDVPMEKMETGSISSTLHMLFVRPENLVQKEGASPPDEFRFVRFIFHNSSAPGQLIALESEHWMPFIKSAMDAGQTSQVGWGNATILAPSGPNMEANTISFDIFPDLKSALTGGFSADADVEFPEEGLAKINELEVSRRFNNVYRRIQVINANMP
ncbi:MAG: hypothetical protein DHS20C17_12230 [Cyclobacteriaceae bacterium]|nr:MAG: hypothetical protein DHS20C17_12230 [Cyclobacteriaceae bacterium]